MIAVSKNEQVIFFAVRTSEKNYVYQWDAKSGNTTQFFKLPLGCYPYLYLSNNEQFLFVMFKDLVFQVQISTGEVRKLFVDVHCFALCGDDSTCLTSYCESISQWDLHTGECIRILKGPKEFVWSLLFAPDGKTCFSLNADQKLRRWCLESGQVTKTFPEFRSQQLVVSPDNFLFRLSFHVERLDLTRDNGDFVRIGPNLSYASSLKVSNAGLFLLHYHHDGWKIHQYFEKTLVAIYKLFFFDIGKSTFIGQSAWVLCNNNLCVMKICSKSELANFIGLGLPNAARFSVIPWLVFQYAGCVLQKEIKEH